MEECERFNLLTREDGFTSRSFFRFMLEGILRSNFIVLVWLQDKLDRARTCRGV